MTADPRRVRIDLAYDGTGYAGWQVQPGHATVQGEIEKALTRINGDRRVAVRGAGRTDAGVHARGQVADAELATGVDDERLAHSLRAMLPPDIRPWRVLTVDPEFHARYAAISKTYVYRLDLSRGGDPFASRYALHYPAPLDGGRVRDALKRLPGRRDWSAFAAAACEIGDRVRTVTEASWDERPAGTGRFTFTADGFLTHMVRNLVGTLLWIAEGKLPVERIDAMLAAGGTRALGGPAAPPHGLCLERVAYGDEAGGSSGIG